MKEFNFFLVSFMVCLLGFVPSVFGLDNFGNVTINDTLVIGTNQRTVGVPVVVQGNYTGNIVTGTFDFKPMYYGGGTYVVAYGRPSIYTSLSDTQMFYFLPSFFNNVPQKATAVNFVAPPHKVGVSDTYNIVTQSFPRTFYAFSANDASVVTYNGLSLGGSVTYGDFGFTLPDFNERMIKLTGGASRTLGSSGSIDQVGIEFTGFGTKTGLTSSDNVQAIKSDGGSFDFLGSSYVNMTSAQAQNYYSGSGSQGLTQSFNISGLVLSFEDGLLVGASGSYIPPNSSGGSATIIPLDNSFSSPNDLSILGGVFG